MSRVVAAATAVLVALGVLTGCVRMPDGGPVVEAGPAGDGASESGIFSFDPRPPQPGDSRADIVRGFLVAMQAAPSQTKTARQFLTDDAAASWNPAKATITYGSRAVRDAGGVGVAVTLDDVDRLDGRGAWQPGGHRGRARITFPMTVVEGDQWRIASAPDALIVLDTWFQERYTRAAAYFFDPTGSTLEPEPVFVPRGDQFTSSLTQSLLAGPGPGLRHVAKTFVPPGLEVAVGVTVSDDGLADILLDGDPGELTPQTTELMMAQLGWTLRQDPAIDRLRVSVNGDPLPLPDGVLTYRVDGGAEYDPAGFQASPLLYGLHDGRLVSGTAARLEPVDGPLGRRDFGLTSVGVDIDAQRAAGIGGGGTSVLVGRIGDGGAGHVDTVVDGGTSFLKPAWDLGDRLWLVDRTPGGARVSYVEGTQVRALRVPGVTGERVRSFLVSRDGTRLVAVVHRAGGDLLLVSRIQHAGNGRVTGATRAHRLGADRDRELPIRAIAWSTPTTVAVLNPLTPSLAGVAQVSVDGSPATQDSDSTTIEGRVLGLVGSPAPDETLFGITRGGLVDASGAERRVLSVDRDTTAITYVG